MIMSVTEGPEYIPLYPPDSPWCHHSDCLPAAGLPWQADSNMTGPSCTEEKGYGWEAWCLGDLSKLIWTGKHFTLSRDSC